MDFGEAIRVIKRGGRVQRAGWNGKGMHVYLLEALYIRPVGERAHLGGPAHSPTERRHEPCIVMFTAQGKIQPGWLASQADMLAEDWRVVP